MGTTALLVLLYVSVNFLLTLIWWTIPAWINMYRYKYNLPLRMVIWPLTSANFQGSDLCKGELAAITIIGILAASPVLIVWMICKGIYAVCGGIVNQIAFSKEEKVQIAVGTIEKTPTSSMIR